MCAAFQKGMRPARREGKGGGGGDGKGSDAGSTAGGGSGTSLPKPIPQFDGCWHCGQKHPGGRRQCPEFRALVKKHCGLPKDYEGAYEHHLKAQGLGQQVHLLHFANLDADSVVANPDPAPQAAAPAPQAAAAAAEAAPDDQDHPETITKSFVFIGNNKAPAPAATEIQNRYDVIASDDEEESNVVSNLEAWAHKVSTGPKQSQKAPKQPKIDIQRVNAIAKRIKAGEAQLPDIELDSNAEYEGVWALPDSRSSVHVVNVAKHFPGAVVEKPQRNSRGVLDRRRQHHS